MKVILSKQTLSLVGMLRPELGYYLRRKGETFFAQRSAHGAPPDGHWRFIVLCAELAQNKLYISDIEVGWMELSDALYEASHFVANRHVRHNGVQGVKTTYNAADIINLKKTFGL